MNQPIIPTNDPAFTLVQDISAINQAAQAAQRAAASAIAALNQSFVALWSLPKPRLLAVLQAMAEKGVLQSTFDKHHAAATTVNTLAEIAGIRERALTTLPYTLGTDKHGTITLAKVEGLDNLGRPVPKRPESPVPLDPRKSLTQGGVAQGD